MIVVCLFSSLNSILGFRIITIIEYIIWLILNKYKWINFCSIYTIPKGSIIFIDTVTINKLSESYQILTNRNCKIIFYFNHFFNNFSLKTALINKYQNSKYLSESNFIEAKVSKLDKSKLIFFPYSAEERFFKANNKTKKCSEILVVGSVITKEFDNKYELKKEFGNTLINPNRVNFYKKHKLSLVK